MDILIRAKKVAILVRKYHEAVDSVPLKAGIVVFDLYT
jgi:hypothetical protein